VEIDADDLVAAAVLAVADVARRVARVAQPVRDARLEAARLAGRRAVRSAGRLGLGGRRGLGPGPPLQPPRRGRLPVALHLARWARRPRIEADHQPGAADVAQHRQGLYRRPAAVEIGPPNRGVEVLVRRRLDMDGAHGALDVAALQAGDDPVDLRPVADVAN